MSIPTDKLLAYLENIKSILEEIGVHVSQTYPKSSKAIYHRTNTAYDYCRIISASSYYLFLECRKWYGETGPKEVPEDLMLTPISLAYWFMGDGSSCRPKTENHKDTTIVKFATHAFSLHSIDLLVDKLRSIGLLTTKPSKDKRVKVGSGMSLVLSQYSVDAFTSLIDPYVIEPYRYKIKRRGCLTE